MTEQTQAVDPFHPGERALQAAFGSRARMARSGGQAIRDLLTDQHMLFYVQLPTLFLGALDAAGRPWATMLAGWPGFAAAPDPRTLAIAALPAAGDPAAEGLVPEAPVGLLGLQFETRRRNRLNGRVRVRGRTGFAVGVDQAFGNCPKYIAARQVGPGPAGTPVAGPMRDALDDEDRAIIRRADTIFLASAYLGGGDWRTEGVDVSHRGGPPGFLEPAADGGLLLPDYPGNLYFNTLGNIVESGRVGLYIPDFESGAALQLTAGAAIVADGFAPRPGVERLIRITPQAVVRHTGALRWAFGAPDPSPYLARLGIGS